MLFADADDDDIAAESSEDVREQLLAEKQRQAEEQRRRKSEADQNAPAPHPQQILRPLLNGGGVSPSLRFRGESPKRREVSAPAPAEPRPMTSLWDQLRWSLENAVQRERNNARGSCLLCCRNQTPSKR